MKKDFIALWKGKQNCIQVFRGFSIANVAFHNKPWKVVNTVATFEQVANREYEPIASFITREDVWNFIKN